MHLESISYCIPTCAALSLNNLLSKYIAKKQLIVGSTTHVKGIFHNARTFTATEILKKITSSVMHLILLLEHHLVIHEVVEFLRMLRIAEGFNIQIWTSWVRLLKCTYTCEDWSVFHNFLSALNFILEGPWGFVTTLDVILIDRGWGRVPYDHT